MSTDVDHQRNCDQEDCSNRPQMEFEGLSFNLHSMTIDHWTPPFRATEFISCGTGRLSIQLLAVSIAVDIEIPNVSNPLNIYFVEGVSITTLLDMSTISRVILSSVVHRIFLSAILSTNDTSNDTEFDLDISVPGILKVRFYYPFNVTSIASKVPKLVSLVVRHSFETSSPWSFEAPSVLASARPSAAGVHSAKIFNSHITGAIYHIVESSSETMPHSAFECTREVRPEFTHQVGPAVE